MTTAGASQRQVERRSDGGIRITQDPVAQEVPVALHYNGQPFTVLMATPSDIPDLALGFSLSEGIVGPPTRCTSTPSMNPSTASRSP